MTTPSNRIDMFDIEGEDPHVHCDFEEHGERCVAVAIWSLVFGEPHADRKGSGVYCKGHTRRILAEMA